MSSAVETEPGDTEDFIADEETREFVKKIIEDNPEDSIYILPRTSAGEVLSEKRIDMIRTIREEDVESIRGLSRKLGRDVSAVKRDLDLLWENDIVKFREEKGRKIPEITVDRIVVEPF